MFFIHMDSRYNGEFHLPILSWSAPAGETSSRSSTTSDVEIRYYLPSGQGGPSTPKTGLDGPKHGEVTSPKLKRRFCKHQSYKWSSNIYKQMSDGKK